MSAPGAATALPEDALGAPALRGLDARALDELGRASPVVRAAPGELVQRAGAPADHLHLLLEGQVELSLVRRGEVSPTALRTVGRHGTFGEEALIAGADYAADGVALGPCRVLCLPRGVLVRAFERGAGRGGDAVEGQPTRGGGALHAAALERERRALLRALARDRLQGSVLGRHLGDADQDLLLDSLSITELTRGDRLYSRGDAPEAAWIVADGLLQLQAGAPPVPGGSGAGDAPGGERVRAYLWPGDLVGEAEVLAGLPREADAVAPGPARALRIPASALRTVLDRHPGLAERVGRASVERSLRQLAAVEPVAGSTRHLLRDVYRMDMARSLLAIDLSTCVRCGHCAWTCQELHGVSRLVRRGDTLTAALAGSPLGEAMAGATAPGPPPLAPDLLLPGSCQQCRDPVCMAACPTGAITRDTGGEVLLREDLCTGCGACAKACPWENVRMAPRPPDAPRGPAGSGTDVAVKCDLCHERGAPACVEACPTASMLRLEPREALPALAALAGRSADVAGGRSGAVPARAAARAPLRHLGAAALGLLSLALVVAARRRGWLTAGSGPGLVAGVLAVPAVAGLAGYALQKRLPRRWAPAADRAARRREALAGAPAREPAGSRLAPARRWHEALGGGAALLVLAHAGWRPPVGAAGLLWAALWLTALVGALGSLAYRVLPARLTRLEREGRLPEELGAERERLEERLLREASGQSELVKKLLERVLLPWARQPLGGLTLALGGRSLADEQRRLEARMAAVLGGRGGDKLGGLPALTRTAVALRAVGARRLLLGALRAWLPLHVLLAAATLGLLALHVLGVLLR